MENVFRKLSSKSFSARGKSHSAENATEVGSYCRNNKLGSDFKNGLRRIEAFFLRIFFNRALAIIEPQIYIVVEHFGAENILLLNGRLVLEDLKIHDNFAAITDENSSFS